MTIEIFQIVKIGVLIILVLYLIFALVIMKQVRNMTATLSVGFEKEINFIALIHVVFALVTLGAATLLL